MLRFRAWESAGHEVKRNVKMNQSEREPDMVKAFVEPPMAAWRARDRAGGPIIATGHQAGFWHPGILAKCIAAVQHAKHVGGRPVYVLVDHDDNDSCRLDLPVLEAGRLKVMTIELAPSLAGVALRTQPRIDWKQAAGILRDAAKSLASQLAVDVMPLLTALEAMASLEAADSTSQWTRAQQWEKLLQSMWSPILGELEIIHATSLVDEVIVDRLLNDAPACVRYYNEAVEANPQAGMSRLIVESDRVELPLWDIGNASPPGPRQRVFADISDSRPMLITSDGEPVHQEAGRHLTLAPRALLLTALMRSTVCDLFIHGHGGGSYDRVMEQWWQRWTGQSLAPMAVVSADVRLPFAGVPQATEDDLARAIWYNHHLPHNLDRQLPQVQFDAATVQRKRELLEELHREGDPIRRSQAFRELHRINEQFVKEQSEILALAREQAQRMRLGMENRTIARRRDWCFAFHDRATLERLVAAVSDERI